MGGASWSTIMPRPRGSFILTGESHLLNDIVRSHLARRRFVRNTKMDLQNIFLQNPVSSLLSSPEPIAVLPPHPTHTDSLVFMLVLCSSLTRKILPKCLQMFRFWFAVSVSFKFHQLTFQFERCDNFLHLRHDVDDNNVENAQLNIIWHDRTTRTTQKTVCTFTFIWHKLFNLAHVLSTVNTKREEFVGVKRHGHQGAVHMFWQLFGETCCQPSIFSRMTWRVEPFCPTLSDET